MESHLHLLHGGMSQMLTGPLEPDGAFCFLQDQKGATFNSLAPLLPRAVPVIPVLLVHTVEEKTAYYSDTKGFEMLQCKVLGRCK